MSQPATQHNKAAAAFLKNGQRAQWHDETLWFVRAKRDKAAHQIPEWEALRNLGSQIKEHTLSNLDEYLLQFEANAKKNGIKVHWANNAAEHNQIVYEILLHHNAVNVVKSKSMLTEECGLNHYLAERKIAVVDTDLGEYIV